MAKNFGKTIGKKAASKVKKKLKGRLGESQDNIEACAKKIVHQAEDMSMSEATEICRKINKKK